MELKPGYKLTDVGVIPLNWDVTRLGECLVSRPRYGINASAVPYLDRLPAYIRITDITEDGRYSPANLVSVDNSQSTKYYLEEDDIVFARTGASVGKSYRYRLSDGPLVFAGFLIQIRCNKQRILPAFVSAYITTGPYWNWVRLMSMRSGQPGINGNEYAQLLIPVPPQTEQHAIGTALSDVDTLLTKLDQLITKKRDLKQAAMQQLLTAQTRLPGFSGEWVPVSLRNQASLKARIGWQALTTGEYLDSGSYYLVTGTDFVDGRVNWSTCHYVDEWRYKQDKNIQLANGDVLVTKDGTIGKVGFVEGLSGPATLNSGVFVIRPLSNSFVPLFLFYVLRSRAFDDFLAKITAGSTITHLYQKDFVGFEFMAPTNAEQTAIASFLSDMDAELSGLEARREKTRALKQGMMQELLTGRIRLV